MHVAHEVVHVLQCSCWGLDQNVDARVNYVQVGVSDNDGDLDQRVGFHVEAGHFAVDPYQWILQFLRHSLILPRGFEPSCVGRATFVAPARVLPLPFRTH